MITGKCERFYMVNMDRFSRSVRDINHSSTLMSLLCLKLMWFTNLIKMIFNIVFKLTIIAMFMDN